jgi:cation diffusion facilitator family transporter
MEETAANSASVSPEQETRQIQRVALVGFGVNLGLAVMKGILAAGSGSLAVTASAIDSATDCLASLLLYAGLKISVRKTPSFPLGLYKIENILSVVVAVFIFVAGYEVAKNALTPVSGVPDISLSIILLLGLATAAILLFGQYALSVGKRTGSPTLMAEGRHRQVDVLSSLVVLASVVMSYFGIQWTFLGISVDQMAAAVVVIFIAHAGWDLLLDGMRVLLDASIDFETLEQVRTIVEKEPAVAHITSLVGRSAGRYRFLQIQVSLRTQDLEKAHQISSRLESRIRDKIPHVERVLVHYEPRPRKNSRIAVPLADAQGTISTHFGESPYFGIVILRLSDHAIIKQEVVQNPHVSVERGKGIRVAEWLVEQKIDELIAKEEIKHKGPGYVFANAGVEIHICQAQKLESAVHEVVSKNEK